MFTSLIWQELKSILFDKDSAHEFDTYETFCLLVHNNSDLEEGGTIQYIRFQN